MLMYCIGTLYTCCPDNFVIYIFQGILKAATPNMFEIAKNLLDMFQQKYPMRILFKASWPTDVFSALCDSVVEKSQAWPFTLV